MAEDDEYTDPVLFPGSLSGGQHQLPFSVTEMWDGLKALKASLAGVPGAWAMDAQLIRLMQAITTHPRAPSTVRLAVGTLVGIKGLIEGCDERADLARLHLRSLDVELDFYEAAARLLTGTD